MVNEFYRQELVEKLENLRRAMKECEQLECRLFDEGCKGCAFNIVKENGVGFDRCGYVVLDEQIKQRIRELTT